jgi:hypothetical protein
MFRRQSVTVLGAVSELNACFGLKTADVSLILLTQNGANSLFETLRFKSYFKQGQNSE